MSSSAPGTPAPTPYSPSPGHQLDPGQVAASIAKLREEVGRVILILRCSIYCHCDIAILPLQGVSTGTSAPSTPAGTPAGWVQVAGAGPGLGVIPEHLAEVSTLSTLAQHVNMSTCPLQGINSLAGRGRGQDEGLCSGSNPATPTPTPFSPSPARGGGGLQLARDSVLAEQLAAGINRLRVETEGMSR